MKERSCNVCGDKDQKRYLIVKKEHSDIWSEITKEPLVANDRVCAKHIPKGWEDTYASRLKAAEEAARESEEKKKKKKGIKKEGGLELPVTPGVGPLLGGGGGYGGPHQPAPGALYRVHARMEAAAFVVPINPFCHVKDLAHEIEVRYAELHLPASKKNKYEVSSLRTNRDTSLHFRDRILDVIDHDTDVFFSVQEKAHRERKPRAKAKPKDKDASQKKLDELVKIKQEKQDDDIEEEDGDHHTSDADGDGDHKSDGFGSDAGSHSDAEQDDALAQIDSDDDEEERERKEKEEKAKEEKERRERERKEWERKEKEKEEKERKEKKEREKEKEKEKEHRTPKAIKKRKKGGEEETPRNKKTKKGSQSSQS